MEGYTYQGRGVKKVKTHSCKVLYVFQKGLRHCCPTPSYNPCVSRTRTTSYGSEVRAADTQVECLARVTDSQWNFWDSIPGL